MDLQISYAGFVHFHSCSHARLVKREHYCPQLHHTLMKIHKPAYGRRFGNPLLLASAT